MNDDRVKRFLFNRYFFRFVQSPPEAAIEATPENTPYATPVKAGKFYHAFFSIFNF